MRGTLFVLAVLLAVLFEIEKLKSSTGAGFRPILDLLRGPNQQNTTSHDVSNPAFLL
jgi:hypothetical protein